MKNSLVLTLVLIALHAVVAAQSFTSSADLLTSGEAKEKKNDQEGALADYNQVILLQPDLAEAYFRRGRVLVRQGKSNTAVLDFNKALELDHNMTDALAARANILLTRRLDFVASIADFDRLINLGLDLDHSYYQRGFAKASLRDFQGAIADYTAVIESPSLGTPNSKPGPSKVMAYSARGSAWFDLGDFDAAIADFTAAINLSPRNGMTYLQRARAFDAKGEHQNAQADYDQAVKISPQLARFIGAGTQEQTHVEVMKEGQATVGRERKTAGDYLSLGNAFLQKKDYDSAIAAFTKSIECDPKFRYSYNNRGNAFRFKNDFQRAIVDHTRAIELAPLEEDGYNNRALDRQRAGDLEGAIKDFSKAIGLAPQMMHLYENRGVALLLIGRDDEAKLDFQQCLQINPSAGPWLEERIRMTERRRAAGRR